MIAEDLLNQNLSIPVSRNLKQITLVCFIVARFPVVFSYMWLKCFPAATQSAINGILTTLA